ncbi:MAG: hypothetical protein ACOYJG_02175 [Prevotella sp.]|jgi:hypothetical protein
MNNDNLSRKDFNELCPLGDLLTAFGLGCYEQRGSLRHYMLTNHTTSDVFDFTVNTARNEWISRRDNQHGQAAELVDYLKLGKPGKKFYYEYGMLVLTFHYKDREEMPMTYPTIDVPIGMENLVSIGEVQSHVSISLLTVQNISCKTAEDCDVREIKVFNPKSNEVVSHLALPCDRGGYYVFDGKTYRPLNNKSISTGGQHKRFQVCNVFENWMDYLAFQERCRQTGLYNLAKDYHVILNGKGNLDQAKSFFELNSDFLEVRTFMPRNDVGKFLAKRVNEFTKGTSIDCSENYDSTGSLSADILPPLPQWYVKNVKKKRRKQH